jgi:hypothetical protein
MLPAVHAWGEAVQAVLATCEARLVFSKSGAAYRLAETMFTYYQRHVG